MCINHLNHTQNFRTLFAAKDEQENLEHYRQLLIQTFMQQGDDEETAKSKANKLIKIAMDRIFPQSQDIFEPLPKGYKFPEDIDPSLNRLN